MPLQMVSSDTVKKVIANMNNSMSKDNNNLNIDLINKYLLLPITYLVNLLIRTNTFPESRKTAIITPIYKLGDKDMVSNYRPIEKDAWMAAYVASQPVGNLYVPSQMCKSTMPWALTYPHTITDTGF